MLTPIIFRGKHVELFLPLPLAGSTPQETGGCQRHSRGQQSYRVIGNFKTSHARALQSQPPLTGRFGGQYNNPQWLHWQLIFYFLSPERTVQSPKVYLSLADTHSGSITTFPGSRLILPHIISLRSFVSRTVAETCET